jgi:hypothetical protein
VFPEFDMSGGITACGFHASGFSTPVIDPFCDGCPIYEMYSNGNCKDITQQALWSPFYMSQFTD